MMKKLAIALGAVVVLVLGVAGGTFAWAKSRTSAQFSKKFEVHQVDFPIPFPLGEQELAQLRTERAGPPDADGGVADPLAGVDLEALAKERAIARGKHLVQSRYACTECHGENFGGGTMIDAPPIGTFKGKNLTAGQGGVVAKYTASDWDRMVRHGVKPDGTATVMPSMDYLEMSDRELSDVVSYLRSLPPVDNTVPEVVFGPVGTMLIATGQIRLTAETAPHQSPHAVEPPAENSPAFGKHLASVCVGCHNAEFSGGPIVGGDPSWPPALNLTPHADGLAGWTFDDFKRAMLEGKRKNGQDLRLPMSTMKTYAQHLTDAEFKAMWGYFQSLPAKPTQKK
jgi:mono/diheme cytochrome c family protein